MKIAVCDDEKAIREDMVRMIRKQAPDADVSVFVSGEEMTEAGAYFDISFLDIEMGTVSGMDAAKYIREKQEQQGSKKSILIFVTGHREYMEDAFDVNAYHYLLKPIKEEKFKAVFECALREVFLAGEWDKQYILVKSAGIHQKVFLKDIYYVESCDKKVRICTKDGVMEVYGKMEKLEKELGENFYRCHRCYLVNMESISAYSADMIQVLNGDRLLLARKKYTDFVKSYMNYARNGGIVHV